MNAIRYSNGIYIRSSNKQNFDEVYLFHNITWYYQDEVKEPCREIRSSSRQTGRIASLLSPFQ